MKGKSLFKKIAAAATTVAMLASVSVVGFAVTTNEPVNGGTPGTPVTGKVYATEINVTPKTNSFGFEVTYNTDVTSNAIGYTMLAYKANVVAGYEGTGANVVGIAQNTTNDGKKFTFDVAKGAGDRAVDYGDSVVILLSSDAAAGAVGYLYTLKDVATAAQYAGDEVTVNVPYNADAAAILTAAKNAITGGVTVDLGNVAETVFTTLEEDVTATVKEVTAVADNKATVVIEAAEGSAYKTETDTTISVPLNIIEESWIADTATYAEKVLVDPTINTVAGMTTAVKDALAGKSVTLNDAEKGYTYAYALQSADIESVEISGTHEDSEVVENATFTYNVTVPAETYDDGLVTVGEGGIKAAITVEVKEDTRWAVDSAELQKVADSSDVTEITIEYADAPADKAALETAVAALVNGDTYKVVVNGKNAEEQDVTNVVTSDVTVVAVDEYTKPAADSTEDVAVTVTVTVPTSATFETADTTKITEAKRFDIEIVVKAAGPAWACGDVDHKNGVNEFDATAILRYLAGGYDGYEYVAERTHEADTDRKNGINEFDATIILRHLAGGYPGYETLPKQ